MKKLLLLFIPLMIFFSCEEIGGGTSNDSADGYNCNLLLGCYEDNENPPYSSLDDCENVCSIDSPSADNIMCAEITINSDTPGEYRYTTPFQQFFLTGANTSATINPDCYNASDYASEFSYSLDFRPDIAGCSDVEIKIYRDNALIKTSNFQLGCVDGVSISGTSCNTYCDIYGLEFDDVIIF